MLACRISTAMCRGCGQTDSAAGGRRVGEAVWQGSAWRRWEHYCLMSAMSRRGQAGSISRLVPARRRACSVSYRRSAVRCCAPTPAEGGPRGLATAAGRSSRSAGGKGPRKRRENRGRVQDSHAIDVPQSLLSAVAAAANRIAVDQSMP